MVGERGRECANGIPGHVILSHGHYAMPYSTRSTFFDFPNGNIGDQQLVLMPDSRRVGIIFNGASNILTFLHTSEMVDASGRDATLTTSSGVPLTLWYKDVAELVRMQWYAFGAGVNSALVVTEILYQP